MGSFLVRDLSSIQVFRENLFGSSCDPADKPASKLKTGHTCSNLVVGGNKMNFAVSAFTVGQIKLPLKTVLAQTTGVSSVSHNMREAVSHVFLIKATWRTLLS